MSECWWIDETPWPGPDGPTLYHAFPQGRANPGDLYLNEPSWLLYRYQLRDYVTGGRIKKVWDWTMVAQGQVAVERYMAAFYE